MSVLKFECPGCGQHMECDRACAGDVIHCPRCCAELRIPFSSSGIPGSVARAELIPHAPAPPPAAAVIGPNVPPGEPVPQTTEVVCPVCESELRIRSGSVKSGSGPRLAELIRKGDPKPASSQAGSSKAEETHPDSAHMSLEERERRTAAAREAHPIQLNAPVKPRLGYVLSGQAPVPERKADSGPHPDQHGSAPPNAFTE